MKNKSVHSCGKNHKQNMCVASSFPSTAAPKTPPYTMNTRSMGKRPVYDLRSGRPSGYHPVFQAFSAAGMRIRDDGGMTNIRIIARIERSWSVDTAEM